MSAVEIPAAPTGTAGLRRTWPVLTAIVVTSTNIAVAALAWLILTPPASTFPKAVLAVGGLITLGIVFIAVSLSAHLSGSRELADIEALLERAEKGNQEALRLADELGADPQFDGRKSARAAE